MTAKTASMLDHSLHIASRAFADDARAELARLLGDPPVVAPEQIAPYPAILAPAYLERLRALNRVLDAALRGIVARYHEDARIRAVYALPPELDELLAFCAAHAAEPYRVGFHRPDFVYDREGQPRICEIGARYPLNGWMLSRAVIDAYASRAGDLGLGVQHEQLRFVDDLCAGYRPGQVVSMVHEREAGTEIFLLARALRERGIEFVQTPPAALADRGGRLFAGDRAIDACILEMDRSELAAIPRDALRLMIERGCYFNDVRTLILVHDKRTLAVLDDEAILADLLAPADRALLRAFLIPSFVIRNVEECEAFVARHEELIAKRSSGGRGIDALVRSECGEERWRARVRAEWRRDMYQRYVEQYPFVVVDGERPVHLVGMQLCRDDVSYGAGVFRGSDAKVINVHGERGRIYVPLVGA